MQPFKPWLSAILGLVAAVAWISAAAAQTPARYPGATWAQVPPSQSGWSSAQLDVAKDYSREIGSTAVVVVQHGAIVASWGETDVDLLLNSARKSLLSALVGIAVAHGQMHLDSTLAQFGIDDNPPSLTPAEKLATVRDLIEARSGVYHHANYETPDMAAKRPARGSHPPSTFWYYNNWDFNTLGAIYEHATGTSIFDAFARQIATPIGMQDFDPARCHYYRGPDSIYPAYLFYASARDLARFGWLFLNKGRWGDRQVIPASWAQESTHSYSETSRSTGYGYLWWTAPRGRPFARANAPAGTYWAEGYGGQVVFVVPAYDLVVVHLARMQLVDGEPRGVPLSKVWQLMAFILAAMPGH